MYFSNLGKATQIYPCADVKGQSAVVRSGAPSCGFQVVKVRLTGVQEAL